MSYYNSEPIFPISSLVNGPGVVVGIMDPAFLIAMHPNGKSMKMQWDIDFPDWMEKSVYYVKYIEPKKIVSRAEFEEQNPHIKKEFLDWEYEKVPMHIVMSVPEDGLREATDEEHEQMQIYIDSFNKEKEYEE